MANWRGAPAAGPARSLAGIPGSGAERVGVSRRAVSCLWPKAAVAAGLPRLDRPSEAAGSGRKGLPREDCLGQSAACLCPLAGDLLERPALRVSGSRASWVILYESCRLFTSLFFFFFLNLLA